MRIMSMARATITTVVTAALLLGFASPGAAATAGSSMAGARWTVSFLPKPGGYSNSAAYVTGTDSRGGYSGYVGSPDGPRVVTWSGGQAVVWGVPAGFDDAFTFDQNRSGTIVGDAFSSDQGFATRTFTP